MKIDKTASQYDNYKLELSFGQILALRDGLKVNHAMPNSDEMLKEMDWYIERLPRPGEEKEKEGDQPPGSGAPLPGGGVEDIDLDNELPPPGAPGTENGFEDGELGGEGLPDDLGDAPAEGPPVEDEMELEAPPA